MWVRTPEQIKNPLWEDTLVPATPAAVMSLERDFARRGVKADAKKESASLKILTIALPDTWKVTEFYRPDTMPYPMRSSLGKADFYVVRFGCSFRSKPKQVEVDWARFIVRLLPDAEGRQPVAFDLHPLMVTQDIKHNIKLALSPTLKFQQVEAEAGGAQFGWEYTELQAVISAAGGNEPEASWDYSVAKGVTTVQGTKWMHMLVKAPKGMPKAEVGLDLAADLKVRGGDLPVLLPRPGAAEAVTASLWG
jgi:hypothetical protein